jgi:hypothetical protein
VERGSSEGACAEAGESDRSLKWPMVCARVLKVSSLERSFPTVRATAVWSAAGRMTILAGDPKH